MRKYQPIWEHIKANTTAQIKCNPAMFDRLIRAVAKEKTKDYAHKLIMSEKYKRSRLLFTKDKEKGILTFNLIEVQILTVHIL